MRLTLLGAVRDDHDRLTDYLNKRLAAIKLLRAEGTAQVDECKRQLRMAQGALLMIDEACDKEEATVRDLLAKLRTIEPFPEYSPSEGATV